MINQRIEETSNEVQLADNRVCFNSGRVENGRGEQRLEPLPLAFLNYLISRAGEVVSRQELLEHVWCNRQVTDDAIRRVVKKVRVALGDDAKEPKFIKTIPLQGYQFVGDATVPNEKPDMPRIFQGRSWWTLCSVALIALIIAVLFVFKNEEPAHFGAVVTPLTEISGSEMGGEYNAQTNTLVFMYRGSNREPFSLYAKDLNRDLLYRLSEDDGAYHTISMSPDGSQILYQRDKGDGYQVFIADYVEGVLRHPRRLDIPQQKLALQGWSADGKEILYHAYVMSENQSHKASSKAIFSYSLENNISRQITFPLSKGRGDVLARESADGQYLAVVRNQQLRQYRLLVFAQHDGKLLHETLLGFEASNLVWSQEQPNSLLLSSFKGQLARFDVERGLLTVSEQVTPGLNDVFGECGKDCLLMRRHGMNYRDIVSTPNPFQSSSVPPVMLKIASEQVEWSPIYSHDGSAIFYLSRDQRYSYLYRLRHEGPDAGEKTLLHRFDTLDAINGLQTSADGKYLLGRREERLFMYDIHNRQFKWLTGDDEQIVYANWSADSHYIYFSRVEQHSYKLLRYSLATSQIERVQDNALARIEDESGQVFVLKDDFWLSRLQADGTELALVQLPRLPELTIIARDNALYWADKQSLIVHLNKLDLHTMQRRAFALSHNEWTFNFDLHPKLTSVVYSKELLAASDLVKVAGRE
ncbi:winged helix-turn-helix domain-containing protein [Pseudoalteromonas luteoviolacea]|uniref:winged helix-turn-helix domain-containing protein n=1 Tax=Pseudoalteromonas luteoviolacea TaxID=43657 RepID=UPI001B38EB35|nr:winged helix-turn-helix domain-containing protein [Pseudoalteromonas luteoviolacea]MBQ4811875.1 winged helix-turn-helix domain-containing protein [Pseudoalteromonas luteoviolacea]